MSIYRRFDRQSFNDVHAKPFKPATETTSGDAQQRTGFPANEALPATVEWAAKLPGDVRPKALLQAFPRIANFLAAHWADPRTLRPYLDELFVDRRGNRQGFPPEVMGELFALRTYYEGQHPSTGKRWDDSMRHR